MFQTDFPIEEFQARRERIYEAIGPDAVALLRGSAKSGGHDLFRQNNDFYYLCGVEVPHAYILLDGKSRTSALYLAHQSERLKVQEGEILSAENADRAQALTGVERVLPIESLAQALNPDDHALTVEGLPAPVRAIVIGQRPA